MGVVAWIVLGAVVLFLLFGAVRRQAPRTQVIERRTYDDTGQPPA